MMMFSYKDLAMYSIKDEFIQKFRCTRIKMKVYAYNYIAVFAQWCTMHNDVLITRW